MAGIHRRAFLNRSTQGSLGLAAALAVGGTARAVAPSDRVVLGAIGLGGRGASLVRGFVERGDVEFAYLCDLDARRIGPLAEQVASAQGKPPAQVTDYRRVLDDPAVDAVVIATTDHWHGPATIFACQAEKDVYVEKPASHNVWEGRKMVEAARKYHRIVQVGTQSRSAPYLEHAKQYIDSGQLGTIHLCKVFNLKSGSPYKKEPDSPAPEGFDQNTWCGPAPLRPYNERIFRGGWHAYWDYSGGDLANDGVHQLDVARWLIGRRAPKAVHCAGGNFAFDGDESEVPDTQVATFDFDDLILTFELTQWAPYMDKIAGDIRQGDAFPYWPQCSTRIELYGTKGLMIVGRHGGGWQVFGKAEPASRPPEVVAQEYGRVPDPPHKQYFLDCLRSRQRPNADIEEGHLSDLLVHLPNIAYRLGGRKLVFDPDTETFLGDDEANALLKRDYRPPFVIPDQV